MTFEDVEKARLTYIQKKRNSATKYFIIAFLIALVTTTFAFSYVQAPLFSPASLPFLICIPLFCGLIFSFIGQNKSTDIAELKAYQQNYSDYFVKPALEKVFTNIDYQRNTDKAISLDSTITPSGDYQKITNYLSANYKNTHFEQGNLFIARSFSSYYSVRDDYQPKFTGHFLTFNIGQNLSDLETKAQTLRKKYHRFKFAVSDTEIRVIYGDTDIFKEPNPKKPINEEVEHLKIQQNIQNIIDIINTFITEPKS